MSRLGKLPITLPKNVQASVSGRKVSVKGPKGSLTMEVLPEITVEVVDGNINVGLTKEAEEKGNLHGLWRQIINNMVIGCDKGYEKRLQMIGVGYRAQIMGKKLDLSVGYSHPTQIAIPQGIDVKVDKNTSIIITGADKQQVGQFAANVRAFKRPEPYKGKGIRYEDEYVRRKAGKAGKKNAQ